MEKFAREVAELFTFHYPFDINMDIACRLACKKVGASSTAIFMYSGKEDKLVCKGRYIDPVAGQVGLQGDPTQREIMKNISLYEFIYSIRYKFGERDEESLFQEYRKNRFCGHIISQRQFTDLIHNFDNWVEKYESYRNILAQESYEINDKTETGGFYRTLVQQGSPSEPDIPIVIRDIKKLPPEKKKLFLIHLEEKLGIKLKAEYYVALPLFANGRYSGILRFLFPQEMPFFKTGQRDELDVNPEYRELFTYMSQIISMHLEENYFLMGYKKTYLALRRHVETMVSLREFLDEQCEALSEIIESRGAVIQRWNSERKIYEIWGYSGSLEDYAAYALSQEQDFFKWISQRFEAEPDILGVHYDCRDIPFKVEKYTHYEDIRAPWHGLATWDIPELHPIFNKLKELGYFNIAILPIPEIGRNECFISFLNSSNRIFVKEDMKMIYPAIQNLGQEWKSFEYEKKKIEKRIEVISWLHEQTSKLVTSRERKGFEYSREFMGIVGQSIERFEIFSHYLLWQYVSEKVPEKFVKDDQCLLRHITRGEQPVFPFKNRQDIPQRNEIYPLDYKGEKFEEKILNYFSAQKLAKIFDFDIEEGYDYFDLPFYEESEVDRHPPLVGIISLFFKKEDSDIVSHEEFFGFMRFFSKQISMAWKNLQEDIASLIQEKIDQLTGSGEEKKNSPGSISLDKIAEILADELNCDLCCLLLADQYNQCLKLEAGSLPIQKDIVYRLTEEDVLSVVSFNQNQNFRVLGRQRIQEVTAIEKIHILEAETKERILEGLRKKIGLKYDDVCMEHWLSVVINIGRQKLGLIKLFRARGFNKRAPSADSLHTPPPFSEFENNLLDRLQKYIFNIILSHQAIGKRMEDMRNVLHQVINPLNALMGHTRNIEEGIVNVVKNPEKLDYIKILSNIAVRYARNFQKILDIDTGKIQPQKKKIPDLRDFLIESTRDYQPMIRTKSICFRITDRTPPGIGIWVDKDLFEHVIFNLLDNAVKYSLNAEERMKLGLQGKPLNPEDKENVLISAVEDDGKVIIEIGNWGHAMTVEEREGIFNREFRGQKARDLAPVGAGIGLYMVKRIVELHGGSIKLLDTDDTHHFVFQIILPRGEKDG